MLNAAAAVLLRGAAVAVPGKLAVFGSGIDDARTVGRGPDGGLR